MAEILLIPKELLNLWENKSSSDLISNYGKTTLPQDEGPYHHCLSYCDALETSMRQSSPAQLVPFLLPSSFSQLLTTEEATLCEDEHHSQHTGQQEPDHIQGVVLDPAEVMGCHTKVLGSFVTHDKLNPEDCSVQGLHWLIVVDS